MQDSSASAAVYDLGHYTRPIRRHKIFVLVCIIIGLAIGVAGATQIKTTYAATSHVLVKVDTTNLGVGNPTGGRTDADINMDTEAQVAKSQPVALLVQKALSSPLTTKQLSSNLTVTVPANTTVLDLTYTGSSAAKAEAAANAFATAYLQNRTSESQADLASQVSSVNAQLTKAQRRLDAATNTLATASSSSAAFRLASVTKAAEVKKVNTLNSQYETLKTTAVTPGTVLLQATTATTPRTKMIVLVVSATLLGLLIGLVGAGIRDRSGRTVRSEDDLTLLGVPTLWQHTGRRRGAKAGPRPDHAIATSIAAGLGTHGVAYLTGVSTTGTAVTLGLQVAQDLHRLGKAVQVIPLSEQPRASTRRDKKAAGQAANGQGHSVSATDLEAQIASKAERADYVLIIGSDAERGTDAFVAASAADVVVLVVEPGETTRDGLRAAVAEIQMTPATLLGGVLVSANARDAASGGAGTTGNVSTNVDTASAGDVPDLERPAVRQE